MVARCQDRADTTRDSDGVGGGTRRPPDSETIKVQHSTMTSNNSTNTSHKLMCSASSSSSSSASSSSSSSLSSFHLSRPHPSSVARLFDGKSVFITGASGFIGRVLLEKLLRSYPGIVRIYVLLRPKKDVRPQERLHNHLLKAPIFDKLRSPKQAQATQICVLDKICVVSGDITSPQLGLNDDDLTMMLNDATLSFVFHSAASVKFDEPLKRSITSNLASTHSIIELCKKLTNLMCLCHVSTAYVNSDLKDGQIIEEKLYPIKVQPHQVLRLAEVLDENLMQAIKPILLGDKPNTYTYTKNLAEHLIAQDANDMPVVIVRPSIVGAAWRQPEVGWVDNMNGPTGLLVALNKGVLRTIQMDRAIKAEVVPVDVVVNTMIASTYHVVKARAVAVPLRTIVTLDDDNNDDDDESQSADSAMAGQESSLDEELHVQLNDESNARCKGSTGTGNCFEQATEATAISAALATAAVMKSKTDKSSTTPTTLTATARKQRHKIASKSDQPILGTLIIHCATGDINPLTWGQAEDKFWPIIRKYPSEQIIRYPDGTFKPNRWRNFLARLYAHFMPALIIDLILLIMGKKTQYVRAYRRLHKATEALSPFTTTNYNFSTRKMSKLQQSLTCEVDKRDLYMDVQNVDWSQYWDGYMLGTRRYVLNEDDSSLDRARYNLQRAYYRELLYKSVISLLGFALCLPFFMAHYANYMYNKNIIR